MEPNDNKQLVLRKAINAHENAIAALNDLTGSAPDAQYTKMLDRAKLNLEELQRESDAGVPEDLV
ncbi:hypothetical protein BH23GEM6_BH23GEM6_26240 [soil metagenome]